MMHWSQFCHLNQLVLFEYLEIIRENAYKITEEEQSDSKGKCSGAAETEYVNKMA